MLGFCESTQQRKFTSFLFLKKQLPVLGTTIAAEMRNPQVQGTNLSWNLSLMQGILISSGHLQLSLVPGRWQAFTCLRLAILWSKSNSHGVLDLGWITPLDWVKEERTYASNDSHSLPHHFWRRVEHAAEGCLMPPSCFIPKICMVRTEHSTPAALAFLGQFTGITTEVSFKAGFEGTQHTAFADFTINNFH